MYLLDTNVVSELRRARPHGAVLAWVQGTGSAQLNLSAVTVGEIQAGIELTREQDAAKAGEIEAWLEKVVGTLRVIDLDARAFRVWARLMHRKDADLRDDAMIAATAVVHGLTVATRNVRDFQRLGVATLNPFEGR